MSEKGVMTSLRFYARLRETLEEDYDWMGQQHADLFRELDLLANNPSDSDARKRRVTMLESAFKTYKKHMNEQRELLEQSDDAMYELMRMIEPDIGIDAFIHKYKLLD